MKFLTSIFNATGRTKAAPAEPPLVTVTTVAPAEDSNPDKRPLQGTLAAEERHMSRGEMRARATAAATPPPAPPTPRPVQIYPDHKIIARVGDLIKGTATGGFAEQREEIMRLAGVSSGIVLPDQLAFFRGQQTVWDNYETYLMQVVRTSPRELWQAQQKELAEAVRDGRTNKAAEFEGWTQQDHAEHREQQIKSVKGKLRETTVSCWPIAFEVADRFGKVCGVLAQMIEDRERAWFEEFGQEPQQSRMCQHLKYIAAHPREIVSPATSTPPRKLLEFAGITL